MLGAIVGDIVGSVYEFKNIKTKKFRLFKKGCFFTDDTVLTVSLAEAIMTGRDYAYLMREYYRKYPNRGYGYRFSIWVENESMGPYNSWGNGSAMRISPVGFAFDTIEEVLDHAKKYSEITHNHPEGIKGAQATASAIFLARKGVSKIEIKKFIENNFGYDLSESLDEIRPNYRFNESCQETVPQAIIAFLESTDFEDPIRNAISLGGDSDTLACITGGIAEAYYGLPEKIAKKAMEYLDEFLIKTVLKFREKFCR
ncbi:ADP-ribosylglycohydrolase family protein [Thermodesulfovibrio yellowstonii]|uniref:ADP-ribosylglycohydrolase family protein n=1 Tax=Thermodesulfovibrio yellowstonii TaxID=28262 RepID=A0A9W6GGV2_9BACT|nr:ADP-ribosylglycohydrolase family protein [Thermodesulfovibrio islandicus]GLI53730.1 hypothetical protein TISLANDTSLP1_14230 [Thermodesulfovibrio islandicus]